MKKALGLLLTLLLCSVFSVGQVISFTGSTTNISTGNNASTVVVDNLLVIDTTNDFSNIYSIEGARVSIISNFNPHDKLDFTTALPTGVTSYYDAAKGVLIFTGRTYAATYQALLRSVTFTASADGVGNRNIEFSLGGKVFGTSNNHFYEFVNVNQQLSWKEAKAAAETRKYFGFTGYLATITSAEENNLILYKLGSDGWIGGSDDYTEIKNRTNGELIYSNQSSSEGKFYWVTGPEAGLQFSQGNTNPGPVQDGSNQTMYANWNSGEPNNSGGEHYAQIYITGSFPGKWNDLSDAGNTTTNGYFVEYGGLPSDPVMDLTHNRIVEVSNTIITTTPTPEHINTTKEIVDPNITITSGGLITNAKVTISANFVSGDKLSFNSSILTNVSGTYNTTTGVLSFTGTATPSEWQALFRTVTLEPNSTNKNDRTVSFSTGNLISGQSGHFYEFVSATSNWETARNAAAAKTYMGLQGYLATITSKTENNLIFQKLSANGWLGGSDEYTKVNEALGTNRYANQSESEGKFFWVTGPEKGDTISIGNFISNPDPTPPTLPITPIDGYSNWYNGEPNNYAYNEHFIEIYSSTSQPDTWNDMPGGNQMGMVVEYGGLPTDPGVVLSASRVLTYDEVLPVRGLTLQLKQKGGSVVLNWSVVGEEKVSHYEVLHSVNGNSFRKIAEVKAKDDNGQIVYSYTDQHAVNGTNYYKIVVVDEDGKLHYSDVRSIGIAGKLQLYPTVITDHFTVNQPNATPCLLTLTDVSGVRLLQKTIGQGINNIETGFLTGGTYFVQITRGSNEPEVFKIIKK